jgi:hypothetical protein
MPDPKNVGGDGFPVFFILTPPMKKLFVLAALAAPPCLSAQDVADKIAKDACPCFDGMDGKTMSEEQTTQFGVCMVSKAFPYAKELKRKHGIDLDNMNEDTGEKLGALVASRMIAQCPGFAEFAVALAGREEEEIPPPPPGTPREVTGTVQETKPGQFLTVVVRKDDGATVELLLLDHVTNAERVYTDPAKARGLAATWQYAERDFLDPYTRTYKTYRVITGIEPTEN